MALGGWPMLNFPVAQFEVDDDRVCDLVLLVLSERSAHATDQAIRDGPDYCVWRTLIARQSSAISKGLHSASP